MNIDEMLESLAEGWDVSLTSHEVGPSAHSWTLKITRHDGSRMYSHTYEGTLASVVARAWAGEPGERNFAG